MDFSTVLSGPSAPGKAAGIYMAPHVRNSVEAPVSELVALARCILFRVLLCNLLVGPAIKDARLDLIERLRSNLVLNFDLMDIAICRHPEQSY